MSFRKRLTLFFVVIVVVPMLAVALVLYLLISDSQSAKVSTRVAALQTTAENLYSVEQHDASVRAAVLKIFGAPGRPGDPVLAAALRADDAAAARRRAAELARHYGVLRLAIYRAPPGRTLADVGSQTAIAPDMRMLVIPGRAPLRLEVSLRSAAGYARIASRVTGVSVLVMRGGQLLAVGPAIPTADSGRPAAVVDAHAATLADTLTRSAAHLPRRGTVDIAGARYQVGSFSAPGFAGETIRVSIVVPSVADSLIAHTRLLSALILGGLLALALALALLVSRSLQDQIASFLGAAQRLGKGDLATRVPVSGRDEFAALGEEFNSMAGQLETRLEELRQQRRRLQRSLQRLGDSFAANLDRDAILGIVLRTAVDGSGARVGRAVVGTKPGDSLVECARVGPAGEYDEALKDAEEAALRSGEAGDRRVGGVSALAHVLRGSGSSDVLGVISVARGDGEFEDGERELFAYLARQAGVSVENVGLHQQVQRQAVTDELTGLFNHRRFVEALESEAERARRFDQPVGLVMVDLDDFKAVNDTYGHQQGDEVLRQVAALMQSYSREIDAPARYGGEELAIVLPQTDLSGARRLAERLRTGIEQLEIPRLSGAGTMRVTASLGVAALPESAGDVERLIAAADAALYEAKRGGKNKTVEAR
jgi:diguanylate cyclase (GGDEF)-like protein